MSIRQPITDAVERAIRAGQAFGVADSFSLQNGGDTFSFVLEVPTDASSPALVYAVTVNVTGRSLFRVIDDPNEDTRGTTDTPNNRRVGSTKTPETEILRAGTNETGVYSGGDTEGPSLFGGTAVGAEGVPAQDSSSTLSRIVPQGTKVQYEVEADQNAREGSLGILFAEGDIF